MAFLVPRRGYGRWFDIAFHVGPTGLANGGWSKGLKNERTHLRILTGATGAIYWDR